MGTDGEPAPHEGESLEDRVLLDTHVLIWLLTEPARIPETARSTIATVLERGGGLLSPMTIWEIAMLVRKGRLSLPQPTRDWVATILAHSGFSLCELTPEIAVDSNELPRGLNGDPVDAILVATARALGVRLATRDRNIIAFARQGFLRVLQA